MTIVFLLQWRSVTRLPRRDRLAFILLTCAGDALVLTFMKFPEIPGPLEWVQTVLGPLGETIRK
ncbi:hypothetical protein [Paenibacillus methanolicus]|nr:hypothetical protein [Paenibacillus methanolicus]